MIPRRKIHMQNGEMWKIIKILFRALKNKTQYVNEWKNDFVKYVYLTSFFTN